MALTNNINDAKGIVSVGNRHDYCYLCAREIKAESERDYDKQFAALKGKLEGKKILKFKRGGTETIICLDHIHKIAEENPLPKK